MSACLWVEVLGTSFSRSFGASSDATSGAFFDGFLDALSCTPSSALSDAIRGASIGTNSLAGGEFPVCRLPARAVDGGLILPSGAIS